MSDCTILLSSAGRRVSLLELLRADARALGLAPRMIATDLRPEFSAACAAADLALAVPPAAHAEFTGAIAEICRAHDVRLLVPTIDPELAPIAALAEQLRAAGTQVNISAPEAVAIARDKFSTALALGADAPRTALPEEILAAPDGWTLPLLAKPRAGSASSGIRRIAGMEELRALPGGYVVQELLGGREFTVNLFIAAGRTIAAVPHLRREVRAGEVAKAITLRHPALAAIARRLPLAVPGIAGALCFQAIEGEEGAGGPKLIEINARFGGGFPIAHQAGAPFTRWLIEAAAGRSSSAADTWRDGVTMLRYDAEKFGTADPATW
jgi:carbamoyl-phosphate synthase large subunit